MEDSEVIEVTHGETGPGHEFKSEETQELPEVKYECKESYVTKNEMLKYTSSSCFQIWIIQQMYSKLLFYITLLKKSTS